MNKRLHLQELVRARQVGQIDRRVFLRQATAVLGSAAAASTLLAACAPAAGSPPPPVVSATRADTPGLKNEGRLQTGIATYSGPVGQELSGYFARPDGDGPFPAVLVIQEWWGLNEHIMDVTRRFAEQGYLALAPDLYHGAVTSEPDEARKLAMELGMRDAVGEISAAAAYLRDQPGSNGRVGLIGFCMGGGLVLNALVADASLAAGAAFYGRPLDPADAGDMQAPVISFLGSADGIPAAGYEAMHAAFDASGLPNAFHLYDGAQHAFFNDTRASYDAAAAQDAWTRVLGWFATYLN